MAVAQTRRLAGAGGTRRLGGDAPRVDADREAGGAHARPERVHCAVIGQPTTGLALDIVGKGLQILLGLESDEIIIKQRAHQRLVHRKRRQHLRRREWYV